MINRFVSIVVLLFTTLTFAACSTINFIDYKENGKMAIELHANRWCDNHPDGNWQLVFEIAESGKKEVDKSIDKAGVDVAVKETKKSIDAVQGENVLPEWTLIENLDDYSQRELSGDYLQNHAKSVVAYQEAMTFFTTEDGRYTDEFGGVFVDENGIYNICVVGSRQPVKSDFLIYKRVRNSFNFLEKITIELSNIMPSSTIWMVAVSNLFNSVDVCIEDPSAILFVISHLKTNNLFNVGTMRFFIGENKM